MKGLTSTFIASGILIVCYFSLLSFFPELKHDKFFVFLIFFAGIQFISSFAYSKLGAEENAERFVMIFLAATGVKFILSLFIVLILVMKFPEQKKLLALSFGVQYMVFLLIDSMSLLNKIKSRN